jgi:amino acid permease
MSEQGINRMGFLKLLLWAFAPVVPVFLAYFIWMPTAWTSFEQLNMLQKFTATVCGAGIFWGMYRAYKLAEKLQPSIEEQILQNNPDD